MKRYGKRKQQKPDKTAGTAASAEKPEKRKQKEFKRKINFKLCFIMFLIGKTVKQKSLPMGGFLF